MLAQSPDTRIPTAPTQTDIRLSLAVEESLNVRLQNHDEVRCEMSPSASIIMGLELEELQ